MSDFYLSMNRSPLSDINRRHSLFDSPNFVRFINKTLHLQEQIDSKLNSTTSSNSQNYLPSYPIQKHRVAITRKLTNMNEQHSSLQLNRGKKKKKTNSLAFFVIIFGY